MTTKPLGDVALGEVRRWANTCDDEGGRLYALPLADAYEALRAENERLLKEGIGMRGWKIRAESAEAENERLRAALEEIATTEGNLHSSWHVQTARAALERP